MQKYVSFLIALFLLINLSACGDSASTNATTVYSLPTNAPPSENQIGGSVQGPALALKYNVTTIAGTAGVKGAVDTDLSATPGTPVSFYKPVGITTDGAFLYVADSLNNKIRKIDLNSPNKVTTLAGSGIAGRADSTDPKLATFNFPTSITVYGQYLYVADTDNNLIRKVDKVTGATETVAGSTSGEPGSIDSTVPTDARFNYPTGITTDGTNLYIADYNNHTIRMINIASKAVTTLAGVPEKPGSDNGVQQAARFDGPSRIATDGKNLYVTDFINHTIRKIVISTGAVSTLAGIAGTFGTADTAAGVTATFYHPGGIATDGTYLYVGDFNDTEKVNPQYWNVIRRVEISSGAVKTVAGGFSTTTPNAVDGGGIDARFDGPSGVTTDGKSLYIADNNNNIIRKID